MVCSHLSLRRRISPASLRGTDTLREAGGTLVSLRLPSSPEDLKHRTLRTHAANTQHEASEEAYRGWEFHEEIVRNESEKAVMSRRNNPSLHLSDTGTLLLVSSNAPSFHIHSR
ncbi:hypothetical protein KUCAC02_035541 [Chaenocephalus aceratus]|nr:hypothetical protein KUCAC02_035541 [Chaenocephalus aceratus]